MEKPPRYTDVQFCNRAILGCIAVREGECAQKVLKMQKNGVKICIYGKKVLPLQREFDKPRNYGQTN